MTKSTSKKISDQSIPAAEGKRDEILEVAAKLFRHQGYAATTLREIADLAGIKAGSIYYHFESKEEILAQVLDTGMKMVTDSLLSRLNALPQTASYKDRIAVGIEGHLHGMLNFGDFTSANIRIYGQIPTSAKNRHRVTRRAYADIWDKLFQEALDSGELRTDISLPIMRLFVIGALNWTVEWYNPQRGSFEDFAKQIVHIVFDGIVQPDNSSAQSKFESKK